MAFKIITKSAGLSWNDADTTTVQTIGEIIAHCSSMNVTYTTVRTGKWKNVNTAVFASNDYENYARKVSIKLQKESGDIFDKGELYKLESALCEYIDRGFDGEIRSWYQRL